MLVVIHTIGRLPLSWRYGISRFIADRVYNWRRSIREATRSNMRHVLGAGATEAEVDRLARQCARNTGRYYADVVGMHRMDVKKFLERDLHLTGLEYVREAQAAGRGVVLASAHYANPEFAVQAFAAAGILVDRDIQRRGVVLPFCGYPARFPTGAVDLALRTNAVLMPGWVRRAGGFKIDAAIGPPLELIRTGDREEDLRVNTAHLLALFEKHLRQDPGQWSVLDRIWPEDLPSNPDEAAASAST